MNKLIFHRAAALAAMVCAGFAASFAAAAPVAVNVGSSEFTIFWESDIAGEPEVRIFADEAETEEITSTLRREAFPLAAPPNPYDDAERRAEIRNFREMIRGRGLMLVRVGPLDGGLTVYARAGVRDESGTLHEVAGPPLEVTTAETTPFVSANRMAAFTFDSADSGSVALLNADGARDPILAVVGDASASLDAGVFALAGLLDEATGLPLVDQPGGFSFEVTHFPGIGESGTMAATEPGGDGFEVAGLVTRTFELMFDVDVAYFQFDPVSDALAGQPFMVRVTARTADDGIAADFSGVVEFSTDGRLEAGAVSGAFDGGVLDGHAVVIGDTGEYDLTALHPASGAAGVSQAFIVSSDWDNWMVAYGDPGLDDASLLEQRLSDPDGTGLPALMRYAFELGPDGQGGASPTEASLDEEEGERYASITFRRLQYAPDVCYVVSGSDDLDDWQVLQVVAPGTPAMVTVRDQVPMSAASARFLRVEVVGDRNFRYWQVGGFDPDGINDPDVSGPDADPGGLGVRNFARYALGMDPADPDLELLPTRQTVQQNGETFNRIDFERLTDVEDVRYIVEATSDYPNWDVVDEFGAGEPAGVSILDPTPIPDGGYRILRVRMEPVTEP